MKKLIAFILEFLFVVIILWFVLGYINFGKITDGKEPLYVVKEKEYKEDGANIHVYDNIIYKIVKYEKIDVTYSLKLWFMKDY